jgi:hypothetical protein
MGAEVSLPLVLTVAVGCGAVLTAISITVREEEMAPCGADVGGGGAAVEAGLGLSGLWRMTAGSVRDLLSGTPSTAVLVTFLSSAIAAVVLTVDV